MSRSHNKKTPQWPNFRSSISISSRFCFANSSLPEVSPRPAPRRRRKRSRRSSGASPWNDLGSFASSAAKAARRPRPCCGASACVCCSLPTGTSTINSTGPEGIDLFDELLQGHLAGRHLAPEELFEELHAAQAGNLSSPLLRDAALRVPLDAGRDPHLPRELRGRHVECGEGARRQIVGNRGHGAASITLRSPEVGHGGPWAKKPGLPDAPLPGSPAKGPCFDSVVSAARKEVWVSRGR